MTGVFFELRIRRVRVRRRELIEKESRFDSNDPLRICPHPVVRQPVRIAI
jgi:hypothetical protein